MKRIYEGWLGRDIDGTLVCGQNKPRADAGVWIEYGENIWVLRDSDFPELTFETSPVKVKMTIEYAVENYKQKITVDKPFSPIIGALPCVLGCGKVKGTFVYMVEVGGTTTLARQGDVIAQKENGEWCVLSKFKEE